MKLAFIGPDMTGKSNIAAELSRRLCVPVFKMLQNDIEIIKVR